MIFRTKEKGRCVFADKAYKKDDVIEVCEYIVIPQKEIEILKVTKVNDYWFGLNGDKWDALLLLGNGSLYNHSMEPNMIPTMDHEKNFWFLALKEIEIGEELVFNYWYEPHFHVEMNLKVVRKPQEIGVPLV